MSIDGIVGMGLEQYSWGLEELMELVPAQSLCCKNDERMTIVQLSQSFLNLTGYTKEEIHEYFQDSFWEIIHSSDRQRLKKEILEQLHFGKKSELEYRILCNGYRTKWVLETGNLIRTKDGSDLFLCVLVDVTNEKKNDQELKLSLERYRIVMDQTTDLLFEWDVEQDRITFSSNWKQKFSYLFPEENFIENIEYNPSVYIDDMKIWKHALLEIKGGKSFVETEIRFLAADKKYIWCRVRITAQQDKNRNTGRAVGVIIDIDAEKKKNQRLFDEAKRDNLTKLFNKGATRTLVEDYMNTQGSPGALFIIDIDDFKYVNDSLGHMFGDAFLVEITDRMIKLFREDDIVGRIGGDEFLVFIKYIRDESHVNAKAEQIVGVFRDMPIQRNWEKRISCSIGIAVFPGDGVTYRELYKKADVALYDAKRQGKGMFVKYEADMEKGARGLMSVLPTAVNETIDSNVTNPRENGLDNRLVREAFRLLYESMNVEAAVQGILEIVGSEFDVSRTYIFENTEDDRYCCNTFEWCNQDIEPEIHNLKSVSYREELGGNYIKNFNEDGVFYCRSIQELPADQKAILEPQGIKSMLQCAIKDNGVFRGYVGFDECRDNRFWTKEQIDILSLISEILSIFLLKHRAQEKAIESLETMQMMLDNQNSWIYVIDMVTYELYYINQKTRNLVPDAELGMKCYEAFFNDTKPCENCPCTEVEPNKKKNCTLEIYNPNLKVWSMADASLIYWKGKPAWMLACHDITPYKTNS